MPGNAETPAIVVEQTAKPERAPTLYVIIGLKLLKGVFFVIVALAVYMLSDNNLPVEYQNFLRWLTRWTHLNPERRFWVELADKVGNLTEGQMVRAAVGTFIYSLFALVEAIGLMFRISWAGWLSIGESAFFIPIEIFDLLHNFSWLVFVIMLLNVGMVWYLFQNRERLFYHSPRAVKVVNPNVEN